MHLDPIVNTIASTIFAIIFSILFVIFVRYNSKHGGIPANNKKVTSTIVLLGGLVLAVGLITNVIFSLVAIAFEDSFIPWLFIVASIIFITLKFVMYAAGLVSGIYAIVCMTKKVRIPAYCVVAFGIMTLIVAGISIGLLDFYAHEWIYTSLDDIFMYY